MRHQAETEQVTRLLLQKPVAFAEIEENARIAIGVLGDDGWRIERIGIDVRVSVMATPISQPGAEQALAEAEARFIQLRKEITKANADQWLAMVIAFGVCTVMQAAGAGHWCYLGVPLCFGGRMIAARMNRLKGAV
jgi:hypothetical protein